MSLKHQNLFFIISPVKHRLKDIFKILICINFYKTLAAFLESFFKTTISDSHTQPCAVPFLDDFFPQQHKHLPLSLSWRGSGSLLLWCRRKTAGHCQWSVGEKENKKNSYKVSYSALITISHIERRKGVRSLKSPWQTSSCSFPQSVGRGTPACGWFQSFDWAERRRPRRSRRTKRVRTWPGTGGPREEEEEDDGSCCWCCYESSYPGFSLVTSLLTFRITTMEMTRV